MPTRQFVLSEIKRVAAKIGRAPGRMVFENVNGTAFTGEVGAMR